MGADKDFQISGVNFGKIWGDLWNWGKNPLSQKITKYVFDSMGNLKSVSMPDGELVEYIVDGQNRRVGKKVNGRLVHGYVYNGQTQIIAELDGSGRVMKQFVYGEKSNAPDYSIIDGKTYRILSDQVGTPHYLVDTSNGKVVDEMDFDEFGISQSKLGDVHMPFGFAGGLYDRDTGLVHFGARDYDPETGRWLSRDPLLFGGGDTNLYRYVLNDPVNNVDPKGTQSTNPTFCGAATAGQIIFLQGKINALKEMLAVANLVCSDTGSGSGAQLLQILIGEYQTDLDAILASPIPIICGPGLPPLPTPVPTT